MEVYTAISDFTPPIVDGSHNILEFKKGDTFEIFDVHKTSEDWWGARAIETNCVGYVPSRYMQVIFSMSGCCSVTICCMNCLFVCINVPVNIFSFMSG